MQLSSAGLITVNRVTYRLIDASQRKQAGERSFVTENALKKQAADRARFRYRLQIHFEHILASSSKEHGIPCLAPARNRTFYDDSDLACNRPPGNCVTFDKAH